MGVDWEILKKQFLQADQAAQRDSDALIPELRIYISLTQE